MKRLLRYIAASILFLAGFALEGNAQFKEEAFQQTYIENCPLGCWANEDDIKGPVAFLASDAAGYVTGATLVMDGGWTIW